MPTRRHDDKKKPHAVDLELNCEGVFEEAAAINPLEHFADESAHMRLGAAPGGAAGAVATLAQFPALYKSTIRIALLAAISVLRLFRRGDAANAVAQAVTVLDLVTGSGLDLTSLVPAGGGTA